LATRAASTIRQRIFIAGLAGTVVLVSILSFFRRTMVATTLRALMGGGPRVDTAEIAPSKVRRNLIECALFPLFRLCQPENPALGVVRCALPAHEFLISNFHELVHELHSNGVKPIYAGILADQRRESFNLLCETWQ
jgi:hypothetical protein